MSENQEINTKPVVITISRKEKIIKEIKSIALILIVVMTFRSVLFEPFRIPSGSMIPTLMIGDFILVNKMSFGFKVPFSDWFSDPIYLFGKKDPSRGDIVVFKYPKDPDINFIKRVIGIPGDTIEIRNKVVYINDKPLQMTEISGKEIMDDMDEKFKDHKLKFYNYETGTHKHVIQEDSENYFKVDFEKITVPVGQFFVMGDNRDFSMDSRYWGFVPHQNIKGAAMLVWFSMIAPLLNEDTQTLKLRPWRIGKLIH
jgi:signal peptidase I